MITADAGILKLKHKVIEEVARLAWNDGLDEKSVRDRQLSIDVAFIKNVNL